MADLSPEQATELLARIKGPARYSTEELTSQGEARYSELKADLEREHAGDYVVIEVESGEYFVDSDEIAALKRALDTFPDRVFHTIRIGYQAAHVFKGPARLL